MSCPLNAFQHRVLTGPTRRRRSFPAGADRPPRCSRSHVAFTSLPSGLAGPFLLSARDPALGRSCGCGLAARPCRRGAGGQGQGSAGTGGSRPCSATSGLTPCPGGTDTEVASKCGAFVSCEPSQSPLQSGGLLTPACPACVRGGLVCHLRLSPAPPVPGRVKGPVVMQCPGHTPLSLWFTYCPLH